MIKQQQKRNRWQNTHTHTHTHTHTQTDEKINKRHSLVDTPPMLPLESEEVEFLWYRTNAATRRWWKGKKRKKVKTLNSKQTINHTPSIISTNKSWKSFKHTKKKKIDKYCVYFINTIKSPKNFTSHFNSDSNRTQNFSFWFT